MEDDYDMDGFGDEIDEMDDFDLEMDEEDYASGDITDEGLSDAEIEMQASMDGESDTQNGATMYSNYGGSVDLDSLSDEQRDLYDNAYHSSYEAGR